jgi:hypothetical protein
MQHISLKKILLASTAVVTLAISAGNNTAVASFSMKTVDEILDASTTQLTGGLVAGDIQDITNAAALIPVLAPGQFEQTIEGLIDRVNPASATLDAAIVTVNGRLGGAPVDTNAKLQAIEDAFAPPSVVVFNTDIFTTVTQAVGVLGVLNTENEDVDAKIGGFAGADLLARVVTLNATLKADPAAPAPVETTFDKVTALQNLIGGAGPTLEDNLVALRDVIGLGGVNLTADLATLKAGIPAAGFNEAITTDPQAVALAASVGLHQVPAPAPITTTTDAAPTTPDTLAGLSNAEVRMFFRWIDSNPAVRHDVLSATGNHPVIQDEAQATLADILYTVLRLDLA